MIQNVTLRLEEVQILRDAGNELRSAKIGHDVVKKLGKCYGLRFFTL